MSQLHLGLQQKQALWFVECEEVVSFMNNLKGRGAPASDITIEYRTTSKVHGQKGRIVPYPRISAFKTSWMAPLMDAGQNSGVPVAKHNPTLHLHYTTQASQAASRQRKEEVEGSGLKFMQCY